MTEENREIKDAKSYILSLVAKKEYTRQQLQLKVQKRHETISKEDTDILLDEAAEQGFFSDQRFAEIYVRQSLAKGDGPLKIKQRLWEKGVSGGVAKQAIEEEYSYEMQLEAAQKLADKKTKENPEKLLRYLIGKGFSSSIGYKILKK